MKMIYQLLLMLIVSVFIFSSCGEDELIKNTDKNKYALTFNVNYTGNAEVKQVRAALFDYETSVDEDGIASGAPASTFSFPEEPLTIGGVDFTKDIKINLTAIEGKKYLVVIYGDADTTDGKLSVNKIDPLYEIKNFTATKDESFNAELKDQEVDCNSSCGDKICGTDECGVSCGSCDTGKICSNDQLTCEETEKTYEITLTVNYSGAKTIKRIGIAGYDNPEYSGFMPKYAQFIDGPITFPYTFTFDPTKDGQFNIASDYNGDLYLWVYGDTDGSGYKATDDDPQVQFSVVVPGNNINKNIEILDL